MSFIRKFKAAKYTAEAFNEVFLSLMLKAMEEAEKQKANK